MARGAAQAAGFLPPAPILSRAALGDMRRAAAGVVAGLRNADQAALALLDHGYPPPIVALILDDALAIAAREIPQTGAPGGYPRNIRGAENGEA